MGQKQLIDMLIFLRTLQTVQSLPTPAKGEIPKRILDIRVALLQIQIGKAAEPETVAKLQKELNTLTGKI